MRRTRLRTAARLIGVAVLGWSAASCLAAELPALIRDAIATDPEILEARANEDVADARLAATRAQRLPVLGVQAGSNVANPNRYYSSPFRGVVGTLNIYSAGAIGAQEERDHERLESQQLKTEQVRERVALSVAQLFLQALTAKQLLAVEQQNLARHQKIIDDLEVIVANDRGRRYELVQAQSRALQVRTRMAQDEKNMQVALARLTRYSSRKATLVNSIKPDWKSALPPGALEAEHPGLLALKHEAEAVRADQDQLAKSRWPRVDVETGVGNHSYARLVLNWNFFDRAADYNVDGAAKQIIAAERREEQLERELAQQSESAEADMAQSALQIQAAEAQIGASEEVARLYEMQFRVGRRSLIELVNAYAELASVEASRVLAENDWRAAVVSYLDAHAALVDWAQAAR